MDNSSDLRKYISFDLDTVALKKFFKSENYSKAYSELGALLHKNGFKHQQGSCYVSEKRMSNVVIYALIIKIKKQLLWAVTCIKNIVHTDIGDTFYDDTRLLKPKKQKNTKQNKPKAKLMPRKKNSETKTKALTR